MTREPLPGWEELAPGYWRLDLGPLGMLSVEPTRKKQPRWWSHANPPPLMERGMKDYATREEACIAAEDAARGPVEQAWRALANPAR